MRPRRERGARAWRTGPRVGGIAPAGGAPAGSRLPGAGEGGSGAARGLQARRGAPRSPSLSFARPNGGCTRAAGRRGRPAAGAPAARAARGVGKGVGGSGGGRRAARARAPPAVCSAGVGVWVWARRAQRRRGQGARARARPPPPSSLYPCAAAAGVSAPVASPPLRTSCSVSPSRSLGTMRRMRAQKPAGSSAAATSS